MTPADTTRARIQEHLIAGGPREVASLVTVLMNVALRTERGQFLGAGHYERGPERRGHANGFKSTRVDTPAGTLELTIPKTTGTAEPFFPQSLERGRRSCRAVMLAAAEMSVKGVPARDVEKVLAAFGMERMPSMQVSRATAALDGEPQAWCHRPPGRIRYLFLDARQEKTREHRVSDDCAVLTAIDAGGDGKRRMPGVSVALSEVGVHWRAFLECLAARGLQGVAFVTSGGHAGVKAARNAVRHAPSLAVKAVIGREPRTAWNASSLETAEAELQRLVTAILSKSTRNGPCPLHPISHGKIPARDFSTNESPDIRLRYPIVDSLNVKSAEKGGKK